MHGEAYAGSLEARQDVGLKMHRAKRGHFTEGEGGSTWGSEELRQRITSGSTPLPCVCTPSSTCVQVSGFGVRVSTPRLHRRRPAGRAES
jgi:hypothetical protein